jgi:hypothetical protein
MKHIRVIALMTVLALISADSFGAGWFQRWRAQKQQRQVIEQPDPVKPTDPVGAPLDGGLLVILGAAGLAYFGVRRKKK